MLSKFCLRGDICGASFFETDLILMLKHYWIINLMMLFWNYNETANKTVNGFFLFWIFLMLFFVTIDRLKLPRVPIIRQICLWLLAAWTWTLTLRILPKRSDTTSIFWLTNWLNTTWSWLSFSAPNRTAMRLWCTTLNIPLRLRWDITAPRKLRWIISAVLYEKAEGNLI